MRMFCAFEYMWKVGQIGGQGLDAQKRLPACNVLMSFIHLSFLPIESSSTFYATSVRPCQFLSPFTPVTTLSHHQPLSTGYPVNPVTPVTPVTSVTTVNPVSPISREPPHPQRYFQCKISGSRFNLADLSITMCSHSPLYNETVL